MSARSWPPVWIALLAAVCSPSPSRASPRLQDLFSESTVARVSVSPTGDWIVAEAQHDGRHGLIVQRRGDATPVPLYSTRTSIRYHTWIGADLILVKHTDALGAAIRLAWNGSAVEHDILPLKPRGSLVDPLPDEEGVVIWATRKGKWSMLQRGPVAALAVPPRWKFSRQAAKGRFETLVRIRDHATSWVTDPGGVPRAVLVVKPGTEPSLALRYRGGEDEDWREIWSGREDDDVPFPLGLTFDGRRLIVGAYAHGDTRGLHELDPESGELVSEIFARPDVDVIEADFDYDGRLVAAVYESGGERRYHYLNDFRERHLRAVEHLTGDALISIAGASRDYAYLSLFTSSARDPGTYYFFDRKRGESIEVAKVLPRVDRAELVAIQSFRAASPDGTSVEAFLALPRKGRAGPPPLVVMPHGGPEGVRDDASFDPLAQLLASDGIAVLKVNYRGSSGYGRTFLEAGRREWSLGIEDDIDAAVDEVLRRGHADADRICIAGASYGGYSALVSAIRRPDRYRCAVTINGPTDLPLLFQSSDFAQSKRGREDLAQLVGDPATGFERLREASPLYHLHRLEAPVLIALSRDDVRVHPEHSRRLEVMLDRLGKPYERVDLEGGHSLSLAQWRVLAARIRKFLDRHLLTTKAAPSAAGEPPRARIAVVVPGRCRSGASNLVEPCASHQ